MTPTYYDTCKKEGNEYERFVYDQLESILGWTMRHHDTYSDQKRGENSLGIEIKCDMKMATTGNIFVEVVERNLRNPTWVPSGIYRTDNSWLFLIGDYAQAFIFSKKLLQLHIESHNWQRKSNRETNTGQGVLIPVVECIELADRYLVFPKAETAADILKEL